ncbi:MAG: phosphoribosylformylglycinamidine synthase subunit PurQ [Candidatus Altiarchaeales archaeon HGW-Altiarchaeales-3]|nr:MAG: phosphoribosylformylglycinamidine synthase subunit PurQ [Candidatus Altiarchaeales archaeon HGW-Altiarchaeales-3]
MKACVLRIEGTNCEDETQNAFRELGVNAEIVHLKQLIKSPEISKELHRDLFDYQILMFPGGFSSGDYVRAGAILAARIKKYIGTDLVEFIKNGYAVGGICNGFQVMVELGILPGFDSPMTNRPNAALSDNESAKFECRPTLLKPVNRCAFTKNLNLNSDKNNVLLIPSAHGEGRFTFAPEKERDYMKYLEYNKQIIFKYAKPDGSIANGEYPWNPNGSISDIAGICNPEGNVMGMMPHPERVMHSYLHHDWTRNPDVLNKPGDGRVIFESVIEYIREKF